MSGYRLVNFSCFFFSLKFKINALGWRTRAIPSLRFYEALRKLVRQSGCEKEGGRVNGSLKIERFSGRRFFELLKGRKTSNIVKLTYASGHYYSWYFYPGNVIFVHRLNIRYRAEESGWAVHVSVLVFETRRRQYAKEFLFGLYLHIGSVPKWEIF